MHERSPLHFQQIEAFLFDLDGTLIESDDRWAAKLAGKLAPLARLSRRWDADTLARALIMAIEMPTNYVMSAMEHLGLGSSFFGLTDRMRRARGLATRGNPAPVRGSHNLLEALAPKFKLAVVTTRARREAYALLAGSHLGHFFPVVVTRQDVLLMKPHPEPVRTAAKRLGVAPEACAMVGDTVADIRAARKAGAMAIGVLTGFSRRQELERAGAHVILETAEELLSLPEWNDRTE